MDLINITPGQCRIRVDSPSQLSLQRWGGSYLPLFIGGFWRAKVIPQFGVLLSNAGLVAGTRRYIYAFDNAGVITLEASATAYVVDSVGGIEVKIGDATRTLVALCIMGVGSPGTFQALGAGTLSWFNPRRILVRNPTSLATFHGSISSATYVEVSTDFRTLYVAWARDIPDATITSNGGVNAAADQFAALAVDTTVKHEQYVGTASTVFAPITLRHNIEDVTDELAHYVTLYGKASGVMFFGGNQLVNKAPSYVEVVVMG